MPALSPDDERDAGVLLDAGWRQASVLLPPADTDIPVHGGFNPAAEFLVVCTQSCNVVSPNFDANPLVEVLVATPVKKYSERSYEASGRNGRRLHMPVTGDPEVPALECDIVRRCFLQRRLLLKCDPSSLKAGKAAARSFAGWLARYYGRTALPNELIRRARASGGPFGIVEAVLKQPSPAGGLLNEGVHLIYLHNAPDDELREGDGRHYDMRMLFLCHDEATQEALDRALIQKLAAYEGGNIHNGVRFAFEVTLTAQTFVADLNGCERFSDWDYFSGLEEARETYGSPLPEA